MAAATVQVQPLGQRVGADQDDAVRLGETFRRAGAFGSGSEPLMLRMVPPISARAATAARWLSAYSV